MKAHVHVSADIPLTARVIQVSGMFDTPSTGTVSSTWDVDLPIEDRDWNVGLIVGPSGSGKTAMIRELFPDAVRLAAGVHWGEDAALIDGFPDGMGIKEIVGLLTSVGLGSPPTWIRPHRTLSTGEAFRASVALTLARADGLSVIDEFTSTVDRQVARVASHAIQKTVRRRDQQLVAVTCHYDVIDWLQPDWVYDTALARTAITGEDGPVIEKVAPAGPCVHSTLIT
jgi:hypothetical protein